MIAEDIKWLHVEPSSRCNAWCPACPRNINGYGVNDQIVEQDLTTARFQEVLDQLPNLHAVQLCGNYGDPIIAPNIMEIIEISKKRVKKIQIHTNGSLRSTKWWAELAYQLKDHEHDVWFGIDGLAGVHEIYRQATSFNKVINNSNAFIKNGGYATWQFIPYAHNEHQIKDCLKLSQELGFKKFHLFKQLRSSTLARHWKTGKEFELKPPINHLKFVKFPNKDNLVKPENCIHLLSPSIYLGADSKLSTCCYHNHIKKFDTVEELLYNKLDLSHYRCQEACGYNE